MKNLESLRRKAGLSQAALARKAEMHPTTVSLIEGRRLVPGQGQLAKLAAALDLPVERAGELLQEVDHVLA